MANDGNNASADESEEDDRTFMTRNFNLINERLDQLDQLHTIQRDISLIKGAIMPTTPMIHSPLKRLQVVSPTPPENCPASSTWTMVDLIGGVDRCGL
jgi:hypothetical protein